MEPVEERPNLAENAYHALADYLGRVDDTYGRHTRRRAAATVDPDLLSPVVEGDDVTSLDEVGAWVASQVRG